MDDERRYRQQKRIAAKIERQRQARDEDPVTRQVLRERIRALMAEWKEATRGMRWKDE